MTTFNEGKHPGEALLSEAAGNRSRETVTVVSGAGVIAAGSVLGKITASSKYQLSAIGAADGSETADAVALYGCDASAADAECVVVARDAEVIGGELTYHADRDQDAEKTAANADLAAKGIIVR